MGPSITAAQVVVTGDSSSNVFLTDGTPGDQIRIDNQLGAYYHGLQLVQFADGTTWSRAQVSLRASMSVTLVQDTGLSGDLITSTSAVSGTGVGNIGIKVSNAAGTTVLTDATSADSTGHWSYVPASLADGSYVLTASETDAAGNVANVSLSFVLDTAVLIFAENWVLPHFACCLSLYAAEGSRR